VLITLLISLKNHGIIVSIFCVLLRVFVAVLIKEILPGNNFNFDLNVPAAVCKLDDNELVYIGSGKLLI